MSSDCSSKNSPSTSGYSRIDKLVDPSLCTPESSAVNDKPVPIFQYTNNHVSYTSHIDPVTPLSLANLHVGSNLYLDTNINTVIVGSTGKISGCHNCLFVGVDRPHSNLKDTAIIKYLDADELTAHNAAVDMLTVGVISPLSHTVTDREFTFKPIDGYQILYADPQKYHIVIYLGTPEDHSFQSERAITIKDTSTSAPYNIYIANLSPHVRLQHYRAVNSKHVELVTTPKGVYIVNSAGGAVTLRYTVINQQPTWLIESQFIGNRRPKC